MPRVSEQLSGDKPKVSVHMITYNHEKFITQAIESVLMQEVDIPVELIIGEDCSTDGTRQIVRNFAKKYPNVIRPLIHEQNLGANNNCVAVLKACRGEYIALLEGDDYWTDPRKLQKQVKFLEEYTECKMCFHDALVEKYDANYRLLETYPLYVIPPKPRYGFADFVKGFYPPTAACLLVNDPTSFLPFFDGRLVLFAKTLIYCVLEKGGLAGFLPDVMSVYRIQPGGIFSSITLEKQLLMSNGGLWPTWHYFNKPEQRKLFNARLAENYTILCTVYLRQGKIWGFIKSYCCVLRLICYPPDMAGIRKFALDQVRFIARGLQKIARLLQK